MHRFQQVTAILALLALACLFLLLWLAKRRSQPRDQIRRWLWVAWCGLICAGLLPGLYAYPGENLPMVAAPILIWLPLYFLAARGKVSMKPLQKWLSVAWIMLLPVVLFAEGSPILRRIATAAFGSAMVLLSWIEHRYASETISAGGSKVRFKIPQGVRVNVQDTSAVERWYKEKLGLRRVEQTTGGALGQMYFKGKEDGNPLILVPPYPLRSDTYPLLFTESLDKMREILGARGVAVGQIERDRMGTRNFEIPRPRGQRHRHRGVQLSSSRRHDSLQSTKAAPRGGFIPHKISYGIAPAGVCGVGPVVVAAAASFKILWWMVNSANSSRSDTPILSYTLRR